MSSVANNPLPPPPLSPRPPYNITECVDSTAEPLVATIQYVAIRKGSIQNKHNSYGEEEIVIRNCIFSKWDDAKIFLQGPDADYEIFGNIEKAMKFAILRLETSSISSSKNSVNNNHDETEEEVESTGNVDSLIEQICLPGKKNKLQPPENLLISTTMRMRAMSEDVEKTIAGSEDNVRSYDSSFEYSTNVAAGVAASSAGATSTLQKHACSTGSSITASVSQGDASVQIPRAEEMHPKKKPRKRKLEDSSNKKASSDAKGEDKATVSDWEELYSKLKEYYEKHGNKNPIKRCPENGELIKWVSQQKRDYRQLQKKGHSRLSASQMQRLNDIGFKFIQRGAYISWDDRMKEFLEFKEKNGHTRVPTNHPTLGPWILNTRKTYQKYLENKTKVRLTSAQVQQLKDVGFIFTSPTANKTGFDGRSAPKPWQERFEELKQFKMQYGHTIVPQNYPQLGWWVHAQRKEYKLLSKGMKSKLDTAKVLKLVEIGFVFDASVIKQNNRNDNISDSMSDHGNNTMVYEEM